MPDLHRQEQDREATAQDEGDEVNPCHQKQCVPAHHQQHSQLAHQPDQNMTGLLHMDQDVTPQRNDDHELAVRRPGDQDVPLQQQSDQDMASQGHGDPDMAARQEKNSIGKVSDHRKQSTIGKLWLRSVKSSPTVFTITSDPPSDR